MSTDRVEPPGGTEGACPHCNVDRSGSTGFCEHCGGDLDLPAGPHVEVVADEARFAAVGRATPGLTFPAGRVPVRIPLGPAAATIGRRRRDGDDAPTIDLSGPAADPAVSHRHAEIRPDGGGGWVVVDVGSSNGTDVAGVGAVDEEPVPVVDGTRIHVGAWTTIVVHL